MRNIRPSAVASRFTVLDFAYFSGWRRREILGLTWGEVDLDGGAIRLDPERSQTKLSRVLPSHCRYATCSPVGSSSAAWKPPTSFIGRANERRVYPGSTCTTAGAPRRAI